MYTNLRMAYSVIPIRKVGNIAHNSRDVRTLKKKIFLVVAIFSSKFVGTEKIRHNKADKTFQMRPVSENLSKVPPKMLFWTLTCLLIS